MSDVDLSAETYENYREAGEILGTVMEEAADSVEVGESHLAVATEAEARIRELGGEPAFPVNISVDEEASHSTPARDDGTVFGEEMVCLDVGVHVDGWIADAATTIDLSGNPEMVDAAEDALEAAIDRIEAGVHTGEVGAAIEEAIDAYDLNPVVNLTGHGLAHWDAHTGPNVPNRAVDTGVELEVGDVVAIEPFVTDGRGKVSEGSKTEIYSMVSEGRVRNRKAREIMETVEAEYRELPFAARWFDDARADMALNRLTMNDVLRSYPVLKERDGSLVSQAEHTVIVTEDGAEVTTR
ncbi:MAG: type II methionyl aminopeptidase [Halanaeroarchaeum sp.]